MVKFIASHFKKISILFALVFLAISCSSIKKFLGDDEKLKSKEFDKLVKIEEVEVVKKIDKKPVVAKKQIKPQKKVVKKKSPKSVKKKVPVVKETTKIKAVFEEEKPKVVEKKVELPVEEEKPKEQILEDVLKKNPFVVGEKTRIEVSYLNMTAGHVTLETKGVAKVNGRLSYHFRGTVKSRKLFSFVYSVDDVADTYVDIENLRPYSLVFRVIETKKTKNSKTYFDWSKMKATYWSRKTKKGRKPQEKKKVWNILEGSQNFVSALFYLRTIDFSKNKKFSFPLADEGKSIILKGKVIKKERLKTDVGSFDAWLVQPEFQIDGSLAPVGSIKIWLKADKSQQIVKIATKLKFGSIVGQIVK